MCQSLNIKHACGCKQTRVVYCADLIEADQHGSIELRAQNFPHCQNYQIQRTTHRSNRKCSEHWHSPLDGQPYLKEDVFELTGAYIWQKQRKTRSKDDHDGTNVDEDDEEGEYVGSEHIW